VDGDEPAGAPSDARLREPDGFDGRSGSGATRTMDDIGRRLRTHRRDQGYSLVDVAKATGLSPSFLSLVENGKSDISIGRLTRLTDFFGLTLSQLTDADGPAVDPVHVVREAERQILDLRGSVRTEFLAHSIGNGGNGVKRSIMTFEPGGMIDIADYRLALPGESFYLILEGELLLEMQDDRVFILHAGDSISLRHGEFRRSRNLAARVTIVFVEFLPGALPLGG
jgi:XRE family transcriptional regulator, regulator of sulfur utilization